MSGVDAVESEVRELVRRRGIDPVTDRAAVKRLVDEVVADYDERALTSALPALGDPRSAARSVYDAVAGFGPLQRHLDDPTVEEVWINVRLTIGSYARRTPSCRVGALPNKPTQLETFYRPEAVADHALLGFLVWEDPDEDVHPTQAPMKGDCFDTLRCRIKLGPQRTISHKLMQTGE